MKADISDVMKMNEDHLGNNLPFYKVNQIKINDEVGWGPYTLLNRLVLRCSISLV